MSLLVHHGLNQNDIAKHNLEIILKIDPSGTQLNVHLVTEAALKSFQDLKKHQLSAFYHVAKNGLFFAATGAPVAYAAYSLSQKGYFELIGIGATVYIVRSAIDILAPTLSLDAYNALMTTFSKLSERIIDLRRLEENELRSIALFKEEINSGLTQVYDQIADFLQNDFDQKFNEPNLMVPLKETVANLKSRLPWIQKAIRAIEGSDHLVTKKLRGVIKVIDHHDLKVVCGFNDHNIQLLTSLEGEDFAKGCIPKVSMNHLKETTIYFPYSIKKIGAIALPIIATVAVYFFKASAPIEELELYTVGISAILFLSIYLYHSFNDTQSSHEYIREITRTETDLVYQEMADYIQTHRDLVEGIRPKLPFIAKSLEKLGLQNSLTPLEQALNSA